MESLFSVQNALKKAGQAKLIAVSKTVDIGRIEQALLAGQIDFGENYVQESHEKWPILREKYPSALVHMIGPLQSNKVKEAIQLFDVIHTLDRTSLAKALVKERDKGTTLPRLFVQVNIGEELQKGGVLPRQLEAFLKECQLDYYLNIEGLMCIPPVQDAPSPYFALLSQMAKRFGLKEVSMGMSADYEQAIQFGATYVRIGSAIFGARPSKA